jgi:hypothetical protein
MASQSRQASGARRRDCPRRPAASAICWPAALARHDIQPTLDQVESARPASARRDWSHRRATVMPIRDGLPQRQRHREVGERLAIGRPEISAALRWRSGACGAHRARAPNRWR